MGLTLQPRNLGSIPSHPFKEFAPIHLHIQSIFVANSRIKKRGLEAMKKIVKTANLIYTPFSIGIPDVEDCKVAVTRVPKPFSTKITPRV